LVGDKLAQLRNANAAAIAIISIIAVVSIRDNRAA
jgi:hypothetical protein